MHTTIEKIERLSILLVGLGAAIGWATGYVHVPSLIVGGIVMQANFWLLKKVVRTALSPSANGADGRSRTVIWFLAKGLFFLVLLSSLFIRYPVHGQSFAVGVSLLLLACVIVGLSVSKTEIQETDIQEIKQTHLSAEKH
jgi:hypothetical protein